MPLYDPPQIVISDAELKRISEYCDCCVCELWKTSHWLYARMVSIFYCRCTIGCLKTQECRLHPDFGNRVKRAQELEKKDVNKNERETKKIV